LSTTLISTSEGQIALAVIVMAVAGFFMGKIPIGEAIEYAVMAQGILTASRTLKKSVDRFSDSSEAQAEAAKAEAEAEAVEAFARIKEK